MENGVLGNVVIALYKYKKLSVCGDVPLLYIKPVKLTSII